MFLLGLQGRTGLLSSYSIASWVHEYFLLVMFYLRLKLRRHIISTFYGITLVCSFFMCTGRPPTDVMIPDAV